MNKELEEYYKKYFNLYLYNNMTIITSYNLKWNSNNIEVNNILLNIKKIINTYDIDFFLFLEAAIY